MNVVDDRPDRAEPGPEFVPGLRLNEAFYAQVVAPILADAFPSLTYSAALIGHGSDVLGFDTARSADHEWGPRLLLFVAESDFEDLAGRIHGVLSRRLPPVFQGRSTHYSAPDAEGVRVPAAWESGPINHKVTVHTPRRFFLERLGVDPRDGMRPRDWLILPEQKLLEATAGRVHHDGLGALDEIRARLAYYPRDVWVYLLAAQWQRIGQQEPFVGRAGEVGDEIGSRLVAAALVRGLMRLCFLMERRYAPYSKWFGTAFARLAVAALLGPHLDGALAAESWREREGHLCAAYEKVAQMHNELGITAPLETRPSPFHDRPFRVIHGDRFAAALADAIEDAEVRAIVRRAGLVGAVDQVTDNVDVLSRPEEYGRLRALYE